ncbi:Methionine import ATP-binding protein MetN [Acidithiobacillus thiooxidans ATCC 19377]|uniref:Methionine import ATP-binding protein MetN n=2 Tax=Acidithiobacillus thiooxidans TaxID=930 RepID=A0A543Q1H1_ACITH|nr:Methionine import ATP-binding protein MetN [Acidithiobacillus thiooxidans ATCC 19377]
MKRLCIRLESIQHIASLTLDMDLSAPGLVCLVGRNGTGKTTLVRALRNLSSADTFVRTATPYAFSPTSRIIYKVDGAEVVFAYDENIRSLNCREVIPSELRGLISAELPMPHGARFNYFKSASEADLDIRRAITLGTNGNPHELIDFLAEIYSSERYSRMIAVTVKGKNYYAIVNDNGTYIREDYLSSGEYFLINLYRTIKGSAQLIVIDEIDISLDAAAQANLSAWLRKFCDRYGRTILFTTHSLAMMRQLEASELFYIDDTQGVISITPRSYSYAKARLFGFAGWDKYILTEDEVLLSFIEAVIEKYCPQIFFRYKIIFIGGGDSSS